MSLLGPFDVLLDGTPATGFHSDKVRALLAYAAVEADRPHRREALAALLWPDQPESAARHSLRQALSNLRQVISDEAASPPFLHVTRQTIQFNTTSNHWLDTSAFTTLLSTCEVHRHRRLGACRPCLQRLERAVDSYRGDFLEGFTIPDSTAFDEWLLAKQEWFHRQSLEVLRQLANFHEQMGDYNQAHAYAQRQIELEPWQEEAHRQAMRALAMTGQRCTALAQYQTCRRILATELGVEPAAATTALYEQIQDDEAQGLRSKVESSPVSGAALNQPVMRRPPAAHNLPQQLTPFVGREPELALLSERLSSPDYRLVTVAGPGGIGKSRLALEAAREQVGLFEDGVYWVPLATVESPERLVPAVVEALKLPLQSGQDPHAALIDYLSQREILLVLDDFEHLMAGADLVLDILHNARAVSVLATSRERLRFQTEAVLTLHGLTWPHDPQDSSAVDYAAVQLFLERAGRARMSFRLSCENSPHVVRICRLLGGMPLGIELAAAWVDTRAVADIASAIEENLDFLVTTMRDVPAHHRSLRAVFQHSWDLLRAAEREALQRLTVFRGGFTPDAAAQVVGIEPAMLATLAHKSLLHQLAPQRYDIHELLCQYAAEKLDQCPKAAGEARARHAAYYTTFLGSREAAAQARQQEAVVSEIAEEIENVWVGWEWAVGHGDSGLIRQAAGSLYLLCETRGWFEQGAQAFAEAAVALRRSLSRIPGAETDAHLTLGRVLTRQAGLEFRLGHHDHARSQLETSLDLLHSLEDAGSPGARPEVALARKLLGSIAYRLGQYEEAKYHFHASLTLYKQLEDRWEVARCLSNLGLVTRQLNKYAEAQRYHQASLAIRRELGDFRGVAGSLNNLGVDAYDLERYDEAAGLWQESLEIAQAIGYEVGIGLGLSNLGRVAYELGDYRTAEERCQESLTIHRAIAYQQGVVSNLHMLGRVACAVRRHAVAKRYYQEALELATSAGMRPLVLRLLVGVAELIVEADVFSNTVPPSAAERKQVAIQLLALVLADEAIEPRTRKRAEDFLAALTEQMPDEIVEATRNGVASAEFGALVTQLFQDSPT